VDTVLRLCHAAERHFDFRSHHELLIGEAYDVSALAWGCPAVCLLNR
jgi:hypothetical protein